MIHPFDLPFNCLAYDSAAEERAWHFRWQVARMSPMSSLRDISIVIVTFQGDPLLRACLHSLHETCGDEPQIVVVDNSPDPSTRAIVELHPNAVYVESPGNPGFAGGNNAAMPFCDRPLVVLLNNDTVVRDKRSFEELVSFMDQHPECGAAQGTMTLPNSGNRLGGCGTFLTPFGFLYSPGFNVEDSHEFHDPYPCFSTIGAFMVFRKEILSKVGGELFRSHFHSYYEETDFCHRVWLSGSEVWYVPTVPIEHLCGATSSRFQRVEIMRQFMRNTAFSLLCSLSFWGRVRIIPLYFCVISGHGVVHLLRGDQATFRADFSIFPELIRLRKDIRAARSVVASFRKVSDRTIFRKALRSPGFSYIFRTIRSNG